MNENIKNILLDDLIVVKRSGQRVEFNSFKIAVAIKKAFEQVMPEGAEKHVNKVYEDVLDYINNNYKDRKTINVEDIQDIIETKLKENRYKNVYEVFSDYRLRRSISRKAFTIKQQHKFAKAIESIVNDNKCYIDKKPDEILLNFGKTLSCEYTKSYILDNKFVRAHEEGSIYIHNLDYFNLGKLSSVHLMFDNENINDFFYNIISSAINAKHEVDGEIAIDSLDYLLVNYLKDKFKNIFKDVLYKYLKLTEYFEYINFKKVEDLIEKEDKLDFDINLFEQFILNDRVRKIFETAYSHSMESIVEVVSSEIRNLLINLDNTQLENKKFSISLGANNSFEGTLINEIYLSQLEYLYTTYNVNTVFKVQKENNMDLLKKVSNLIILGKNISLSFVETSYNKDSNNCIEYFSDGKRIFENPVYAEKGAQGRMIVCSVSVNMGRLGFKYKDKLLEDFYSKLDELLDLSKNCLISIFETIGDKCKDNYRVIFNNNILDDDKLEKGQKIRKIIKKGVLNLELAGVYECVCNLESDKEKQKELISNILEYIEKKVDNYTIESKLNFIVSETCKHRPLRKLMELDKSIYGIKKGITDKEYYGRIDNLFDFKKELSNDLKYIGKYQKMLSGGNLVKVTLSKNVVINDILKIIMTSLESDVGFLKFEVRR